MTNRGQFLRSSVTGNVPAAATRAVGELWMNFADKQLGMIDASRNAQKLIAVRYFTTTANYVVGDWVIQGSGLYVANSAITAGTFNPAQWTKTATAADLSGLYLPLTGGTVGINQTAAITTDKSVLAALTQSGLTAQSIYWPNYGVPLFDTLRSVSLVPPGSTVANVNGVGAYVLNQNPLTGGGVGSGVGLYGCAVAAVNGAGVWGANTLCTDSLDNTANAQTGNTLCGYEADFNICSPNSNLTGVMLAGLSKAQPAVAVGFAVASLGNGVHWTTGFATASGVAQVGLSLGASAAAGNSVPSQPIFLDYFNSTGVLSAYTLQVDGAGALNLGGSVSGTSAAFAGGVSVAGALNAGAINSGAVALTGNISITAPGTTIAGWALYGSNAALGSQFYYDQTANRCVWTNAPAGCQINMNGDVTINPGAGHNFILTPGTGYQAGGGPWNSLSDARIKDVHGDYEAGLTEILDLRPVRYSYRGNDALTEGAPSMHAYAAEQSQEFIGFVAQEVETIMPEMVTLSKGFIDGVEVDDLRNLNTNALAFALVNAVKQLKAEVDALRAQLARR